LFTRLSPQKVRSDIGYIVQIGSRTSVEYLAQGRKVTVEVDFADTVGVYVKTLSGWIGKSGSSLMNDNEKKEIISRIVAGLKAMGSNVELC
jgi:hypothetical protein